jgi:hypothetical protein
MKTVGESISGLVANFGGNTLKGRCVRSSVALSIGAFVAKFFGFSSKVILTRLLVPQEIGLMVMILSLTAFFEVISEIGIKQSVIQHKNGANPEYLNMAWWLQSLRAIGLYAIAFITAPWLCEFYFRSKPEVLTCYSMGELITLIRVAFLSILFNGFISPEAHILVSIWQSGSNNAGQLCFGDDCYHRISFCCKKCLGGCDRICRHWIFQVFNVVYTMSFCTKVCL